MKIRHHHAALALLAAAAGVQAETSPYYIGGLVSYTHQSNVLGLADGDEAVPTGYKSKSDNVTSLALVGGMDQTISRQRVFGDVTLRSNRYSDNTALNNNSYALTAGADWATVENISGNVTFRTNRDLFRYGPSDPARGGKNLVTSKQADALARIGGATILTFEGALGYRSVDYSLAAYDPRDNRQTYWQLGARYAPSPDASVGLNWRDTSGRYPRYSVDTNTKEPVADRFDRRDLNLVASLKLSGLTDLFARVSHTKVDYDIQRDFSGFTGLLRVTWLPTAKLRLNGEVARDRGQDLRFDVGQEYDVVNRRFVSTGYAETARLVTTWRVRAEQEITGKVSANAGLYYLKTPVTVTTLVQGANVPADGNESTRQFSLGATWLPTRTSRVGCDLSRERRRDDVIAQQNVSSNSLGCYAQLTLQP